MKKNSQHNEIIDLETDAIKHVDVPFKNTKEDVWAKLSSQIDFDNPPSKQGKLIKLNWFTLASAAAIVMIFGSTLFLKNYSISIVSNLNEKFSHTLPDHSTVFLNENSTLTYHPYWWRFNRALEFEGEAFFEVEKGKKFTVISKKGNTSVLGTSFNINSRTDYTVYCKTGKVEVRYANKINVVLLTPNQMVSFKRGVKLKKDVEVENAILNWRKTYLNFESTSVIEVFTALEKIYNVNLNYETSEFLNLNYSANYEKPLKVEDVLLMLSLNFNFSYSEHNTNYTIVKNP
jgi:ferric-dicitrate binding protein FerR (iron transport regulator)